MKNLFMGHFPMGCWRLERENHEYNNGNQLLQYLFWIGDLHFSGLRAMFGIVFEMLVAEICDIILLCFKGFSPLLCPTSFIPSALFLCSLS